MQRMRAVVLGPRLRDLMLRPRPLDISTVGFEQKPVVSPTVRTSQDVSVRGTNWFVATNTPTIMSRRLKTADMLVLSAWEA